MSEKKKFGGWSRFFDLQFRFENLFFDFFDFFDFFGEISLSPTTLGIFVIG
jgi:hypothetical protein